MDLFRQASAAETSGQPLAARMRPRTLEEFVGQEHIVGPGRLLRRAIQADQLSSIIFYGPPGSGKTTLARVIANTTKSRFVSLNAVLSGVKEVREVTAQAQEQRDLYARRTILFVDEVHRWNKAQQDALLPWVENGTVILIGATTENPYFEVIRALVSRSRIFQLLPLEERHLRAVAEQALRDPERGYGKLDVRIDPDALDHLVRVSNGDARSLLNALELAVETTPERFPPPPGEAIPVTMAVAEESIQRRAVLYDKEGDYHFDTASAFIKSLRGSDPDAALYWMAKMVYAGEDPAFIFRRMMIFASEDVGLADPHALVVVQSAAAAYDRVGMPEGRFHLAEAALYLSTAPKSNSAMAFFDALKTVEQEREGEVPSHLKDSSRDSEGFGHGEGYLYPHAFRDHWVAQQYLPDSLRGRMFYQPGAIGFERGIREEVARRREAQLAALLEQAARPVEVLSTSPPEHARDAWLARTVSARGGHLGALRDRLAAGLRLQRHHAVLNVAGDDGLFVWELLRRVPEGGVWVTVRDERAAASLRMPAPYADDLGSPKVLIGDPANIGSMLEAAGDGELKFDAVVGRNVLALCPDRERVLRALRSVTAPGGRLAIAETVPARSQRLADLLPADSIDGGLRGKLREAEEAMHTGRRDECSGGRDGDGSRQGSGATSGAGSGGRHGDPRLGWTESDLAELIRAAGFTVEEQKSEAQTAERFIRKADIERWFSPEKSYAKHLARFLDERECATVKDALLRTIGDTAVAWRTVTVTFLATA